MQVFLRKTLTMTMTMTMTYYCTQRHGDTEVFLTMTMTITMTFGGASLPWKPCKNGIKAWSLRHSYGASMAFLQRLKILQARCGWIRL
jgi:hypothetical protein